METKVTDFKSISIRLASPEKILAWSRGEVTKPETINYRTQRAEKDGLFDERIFGPEKDYECYCGKYRRIRYKGIICDKCGVEVTRSIVRRERMGHIRLASPVSHIWFMRGVPSRVGLVLNLSIPELERVIYFAGYIITKVNDKAKEESHRELEKEFKSKAKKEGMKEKDKSSLKEAWDAAKKEIDSVRIRRVLSEVEYHRLSLRWGEVFEAGIGAEALFKLCKDVNMSSLRKELEKELEETENPLARKKVIKRLSLVKAMERSGTRPEWMFLNIIPVSPPALRPMVQLEGGRHATSDVNDLYRRVINRNNRLKKLLELKAPEVIVRNEKRMLQEAVDALLDNSIRRGPGAATSQAQKRPLRSLADMLKGKQGRFRQNLLGKRVDYSGRSVIVVGPDLKLHQCGLPKHMALELFRPFVINKLITAGLAHNIRSANRLIDDVTSDVWAILEDVIRGKYVLLNRAPTLHRLGIQAFQPILIEGNAIQIHPMVCSAFNADFDGDQMAVHVPLTEEAQREAADIMAATKNLLKPGTADPTVTPSQDMVIGCYWLTKLRSDVKGEGKIFSNPNEAVLAYDYEILDLKAKIKVRATMTPKYKKYEGGIFETSVGRLLFNSVLPNDFEYMNEDIKKKILERIVAKLIVDYGVDKVPPILDKIKSFGFKYATVSGISWGMDDLKVPEQKSAILKEAQIEAKKVDEQYNDGLLTDEERYDKVISIWAEVKRKVDEIVPTVLNEEGPIHLMVSSAARGTWTQVTQMTGMKGLVRNPAGRTIELPILSSYKEGLNVLEYFISTHGARKGTADTALKTAHAGYLTRRLVDVAQELIIREEDCKDTTGLKIIRKNIEEYGKSFNARIFGRVLAQDAKWADQKLIFKKGHLISHEDADLLDKSGIEIVTLRSPISCQTLRGLCQTCYGYDLGSNATVKMGEAVGIVAAQAIGEPGTQLTMRTFHVGGVAGASDITMGLPRIEEIFELRLPKNAAVLSDVDGTVIEIGDSGREKVVKILVSEKNKKKGEETKEFVIPFGRSLTVQKESEVKKGQALCEGPIDIKELFGLSGTSVAQNYIISEVGKIYSLQGASINDKHVEVIVSQMFSRIRVKDSGDTKFAIGDVIEKTELIEENEKVSVKNGKVAEGAGIVLGITKTALSTSSFLAAASFQETTRVLISASLEGKEDKLHGLKENVIIGRLIPAGTGYRKDYESKDEEEIEEEYHRERRESRTRSRY
ncbi:DNA-directed RNA polymerase subunit beta' [Candidatus Giovannonibacteria bacterium RIFCSPLOWO2_02_FULL_43_11b]|uniref:DNA-directed RNA polymerase subunit beta' n=1 Tax=Candidatus Giovannonibacteria bacterium RIFCSPHIGHO2_12_FULL_43_15 TaxID=1798341 RepID=A0A1F5WRQ5_9BACT|nr:MAG: DNA-directed RNA polymerase subunit beta' [Candidatus Giovannonibacteria bacterium RIFCSPHIGHO2_01_FULL_43_100]OGF67274.1 MAG: DNA-directed RNA polymerase subunit beta' [Candidatus Giovannonibacteria bacterium RIFCSPHIGHO2_02_FULL_43_32]OGF78267.1 MAG: DNA-directed RNA polymerase subunit beta' [Candidatus Giovannonibacteria bacterium RIFCSPHIGHO2_12_FULL_43_15]OGF78772.1 MAG: DNA-directed RNA polymerase subunit beta' [Candidatus Giovannonibacteria bacterium RIFCSPLOWO2_01_FULL_43_60]OGF